MLRKMLVVILLVVLFLQNQAVAADSQPHFPLVIKSIAGQPLMSVELTGNKHATLTPRGLEFASAAEAHAYLDSFYHVYLAQVRAAYPGPFATLEAMYGPSKLSKEIDEKFSGWSEDGVTNLIERALTLEIMLSRNFRQNAGNAAAFNGKLLEILFAHRFYFEGKRALTPFAVIPPLNQLPAPLPTPEPATSPIATPEPDRLAAIEATPEPAMSPVKSKNLGNSSSTDTSDVRVEPAKKPAAQTPSAIPTPESAPEPSPSSSASPEKKSIKQSRLKQAHLALNATIKRCTARAQGDQHTVNALDDLRTLTERVVSEFSDRLDVRRQLEEQLTNWQRQLTEATNVQMTAERITMDEIVLIRTQSRLPANREMAEALFARVSGLNDWVTGQTEPAQPVPTQTNTPATPASAPPPTTEPESQPATEKGPPAPKNVREDKELESIKFVFPSLLVRWDDVPGADYYSVYVGEHLEVAKCRDTQARLSNLKPRVKTRVSVTAHFPGRGESAKTTKEFEMSPALLGELLESPVGAFCLFMGAAFLIWISYHLVRFLLRIKKLIR